MLEMFEQIDLLHIDLMKDWTYDQAWSEVWTR